MSLHSHCGVGEVAWYGSSGKLVSPTARLTKGWFPPTVNPEEIASSSPGLRPRSFRQPFAINTTQMLTVRHRRIDTPAQKERGSYPGKSCKPRLNPAPS